jgi:hypothetical protein
VLTADQVELFRKEGYLAPLPALSDGELSVARASLDSLLQRTHRLEDPGARHKPHLYAKWVSDLVRHPRVLDAVESLLGPDLLVWRSVFFVKGARDPRYVDWHQDSVYWGLSPDDVVTAWIALTESRAGNGCLRVVPGSHRQPEVRHAIRLAGNNLLVRGQRAMVDVSDDEARDVELRAGEMSLHHVRLLHGSRPNASGDLRAGLAVRYVATRVRQRGPRQSATLVRGKDAFGHFDLEPQPRRDGDPEALAWHRRSRRRYAAELLWATIRRPSAGRLMSAGRLFAHPARLARAVRSFWGGPG